MLARWWFAYDAGRFDELAELLESDVHFACRTDTGETSFEEFVRANASGRDAVLRWHTEHRLDRPYPLRHHACWTCYQYGSICANPSGGSHDA